MDQEHRLVANDAYDTMTRRAKDDNTSARQKRVRSFRTSDRRKQRATKDNAPESVEWLTRSSAKMAAMQVINNYRERPYILSIPKEDGPEPISGYYPCSMTVRGDRLYYHFLFREHRDATCAKWPDARKEFTA